MVLGRDSHGVGVAETTESKLCPHVFFRVLTKSQDLEKELEGYGCWWARGGKSSAGLAFGFVIGQSKRGGVDR